MRTAPAPDKPEVRRRARPARPEGPRRALTHLLALGLGALVAVAVGLGLGLRAPWADSPQTSPAAPSPSTASTPAAVPPAAAPAVPSPSAAPSAPPSPSAVPSPAASAAVLDRSVREAEDGDLDGRVQRASDAAASGGAFVGAQDGEGDREGSVTLVVDVPAAGSYVVWARVLAPDEGSNSFFVQIDDGEELTWHAPGPARSATADEWTWAAVREEDADTPQLYLLEAGRHELRFGAREDGAGLDRVVVTSDLAEVPGDSPRD